MPQMANTNQAVVQKTAQQGSPKVAPLEVHGFFYVVKEYFQDDGRYRCRITVKSCGHVMHEVNMASETAWECATANFEGMKWDTACTSLNTDVARGVTTVGDAAVSLAFLIQETTK